MKEIDIKIDASAGVFDRYKTAYCCDIINEVGLLALIEEIPGCGRDRMRVAQFAIDTLAQCSRHLRAEAIQNVGLRDVERAEKATEETLLKACYAIREVLRLIDGHDRDLAIKVLVPSILVFFEELFGVECNFKAFSINELLAKEADPKGFSLN